MKSPASTFLTFTGALALGTAVLFAGCSKTDNTSAGTSPTTSASSASSTTTVSSTDTWDNVKDYSYDQRTELQAKADALASRLEDQTTKVSGAASRQLADARDELRSATAEISNATSETWESTKERIGQAWQKAESAVQSVAE